MDSITLPHDTVAFVVRLLLATVLGAAIGFNREIYLKPAGLRTHAMVSLGAALMAYIGLQLGRSATDGAAVSRIIQGMVAGIGFIGGGVILRNPRGRSVHGLTTAASIWVVAGIGVATGVGLWRAALTTVVLALAILTIGQRIDNELHRRSPNAPDDN